MAAILRAIPALLSIAVVTYGSVIPAKDISNGSKFVFDSSSSGYIVTAGGWNSPNAFPNAYVLDLNSGEWTEIASLPLANFGFNLVLRDSSVYAVGGYADGYNNGVSMLSIEENMWKAVSDLIYNKGRVLSASFNGSLYAVGGEAGGNTLQAMGCKGAWRKLPPSIYSHDEEFDAIAVLNNKIYVHGYYHRDEVYDPSTNTWTAINMTNQDRIGAGIVALNGYIYVIGGANAKNERYDPTTGEIIYFEACLFNMVQYAAVVTDGEKIYVIGGHINGVVNNKVQVYRPDLDMWQSMTQYPIVAGYMGAVYVKELPTD